MPSTVGIDMKFVVTGLKALEDASAAVNTISNANKVIKISIDPNEVANLKLLATVDVKKLASLASINFSGLNTTGLLTGVTEISKAIGVISNTTIDPNAVGNINKIISAIVTASSNLSNIQSINVAGATKKIQELFKVISDANDEAKKVDQYTRDVMSSTSRFINAMKSLANLGDIDKVTKLSNMDNIKTNFNEIIKLVNSFNAQITTDSQKSISSLSKFFNSLNTINVDVSKIVSNLTLLGNAINGLSIKTIDTKGLNDFIKAIQALDKMPDVQRTINKLQQLQIVLNGFKINMDVQISEISKFINALNRIDKIPDVQKTINKLQQLQIALNGFKINISVNIGDIGKLITQINRMDKIDDVKIKTKLDSLRTTIEHFITLPMNNSNLLKFLEQINLLNRGLNQNTQNIQNNVSNMGMALSSLGLNVGIGGLKSMITDLQHLEKTILQVGIAGGLGEASMKQLRGTFYNLSMTTGLSANEVAVAAETIVKTGQDFESTMKILEASTKLAVATGENLNYVAEALSKILLVLRIDADDTTEVMNKLMSVVNKTPASMRSMMEMLKQSNAGFANFIDMTSKSGVELEGYKKKILDLELSMGGALALLGRKGEYKIALKSFNCGKNFRAYLTKIA